MGVSKNSGTPKWMVKIMENPIKMDDLRVPLFLETPIDVETGRNTKQPTTWDVIKDPINSGINYIPTSTGVGFLPSTGVILIYSHIRLYNRHLEMF